MQHFEEALRDAEVATQLRPDWAKVRVARQIPGQLGYFLVRLDVDNKLQSLVLFQAYFRKGTALEGLSHYEEAAYAYLQCLTLDSEATAARTALTKVNGTVVCVGNS